MTKNVVVFFKQIHFVGYISNRINISFELKFGVFRPLACALQYLFIIFFILYKMIFNSLISEKVLCKKLSCNRIS